MGDRVIIENTTERIIAPVFVVMNGSGKPEGRHVSFPPGCSYVDRAILEVLTENPKNVKFFEGAGEDGEPLLREVAKIRQADTHKPFEIEVPDIARAKRVVGKQKKL